MKLIFLFNQVCETNVWERPVLNYALGHNEIV